MRTLRPITKGCNWAPKITVDPDDGQTEAELVADLTGASVTAVLEQNGTAVATCTAVVADASAREIVASLTAAQTAAITSTGPHRLDVRYTTAGGDTWAVGLERPAVDVRSTP